MRLKILTGRLISLAMLAGVGWLPSGRAAESPDHATTEAELAKLQGSWTMASLETRGKTAPADSITNYVLTIKGDVWTVAGGGQQATRCSIRLYPSDSPKRIDLTPTNGNAQARSQGIYKLDGDTLTLCRTLAGRERPKEFKTTESTGILAVWKRAKK
jgi:uncharacterized protein (TIGR03067 family)